MEMVYFFTLMVFSGVAFLSVVILTSCLFGAVFDSGFCKASLV